MNKRANEKKRKPRRRTTTHASARGPFLVAHPLRGAELAIRRSYVAVVAETAATRFEEHLGRLVALTAEVSPLHVLAILSSYALMKSVDSADVGSNRPSRTGEVLQGHVEYLQALLLRHPWVARAPPEPELMQEVFDVLPALFEAYGQMRVPHRRGAPSDEDPDAERVITEQLAIEAVQEVLRSHTALVRNWGYFNAVKRIASEVLASADAEFCTEYGLTLTQVISLFEHLVRRFEGNVNDFRRRMFEVFQAGSPPQMARELADQFAEFKGVEDLRELLCDGRMTPREARFRILVALEGVLPKFLLFDAQSISGELGFDEVAVLALLKRLSLSFGDLRDRTPESLLLDNPTWLRPLIEVHHGIFFSAVPQTLMSFVLQIVESLAQPHVALRERLQRGRAQYLEDATEKLLRMAFPGCELVRGFKWMEGDRRYESDLALRYDATILLVESKSGGVSWSALRGAPQRMVRQIQNLIVDPSDQSARLAERLKEAIAGTPGPVADFPLSLEGVYAISRLSVTLHDFATVQSFPRLLRDAGLIRSEHRLAPCLTLADLEVVVDILDTPYLRMHYLRRRAELLTTAVTFGDELDSLGMYLDTGFNIGEAEAGAQQLMMIGYSAKLDRYYSRIDESLPARKPKVNITPWIRALCDQLMARAASGWYEMTHALLTLGHDEQLCVERELRKRMKWMRNGKPAKNGLDSILVVPQSHRRMAVAFQMRTPDDRRPSKETAVNLASQAFEASHVEVCAIFGFRADVKDMSYRSANLWYRTDRLVETRTYL